MIDSIFSALPGAHYNIAKLAGAVEYTNCTSVDGEKPNKCPGYDTKQSDGEVPGMWTIPSLPSHRGPLWTGVVAPEKGPIYE